MRVVSFTVLGVALGIGCAGCGDETGSYAVPANASSNERAQGEAKLDETPPPPHVVAALPDAEQIVGPDALVKIVFSEPMDASASSTLSLYAGTDVIPGSHHWDGSGTVLAFRPAAPLGAGVYAAEINPDAQSRSGQSLLAAYTFTFVVQGDAADGKP